VNYLAAIFGIGIALSGCSSNGLPGDAGFDGHDAGFDGHDAGFGDLDCPAGLMPGGCGLEDRCVECITDMDCNGETCMYGMCALTSVCTTDSECQSAGNNVSYCVNGRCVEYCEHDADCLRDEICLGVCEWLKCRPDGTCPEGWVPGWGGCSYDPCVDQIDKIPGACGLHGECVECFADSQCAENETCDNLGECVITPRCETNLDCQSDYICFENKCHPPCESESDCAETEYCDVVGNVCVTVRCDSSGKCSRWGYRPIVGTLECRWDPCFWNEGLIPGVCGLAERCIWCIVDEDCQDGEFCNSRGFCHDYPECNDRCVTNETCFEGKCYLKCETDSDCNDSAGICMPEGYCHFERCSKDGTCPPGWLPGDADTVPGRLYCVIQ